MFLCQFLQTKNGHLAKGLGDKRDSLRKSDPTNPTIPQLNQDICDQINEHKRKKCNEHLKSCAPNSNKLWKTICQISNPKQTPCNINIKFDGKHFSNISKIANL